MALRDEGPHCCRRYIRGAQSIVGTATNVADATQANQLLRGVETYVSCGVGYGCGQASGGC